MAAFMTSNTTYGTAFGEVNWIYTGSATYQSPDYKGYIKVDKGSPDKARYVIFYAILKSKDPMIFCKNKTELAKELKKLAKRTDVDQKSIRFFSFAGGIKRAKAKSDLAKKKK